MRFGNALDNGKSEAGAVASASIGAPEALRDALAQLGRHARTVIVDLDGGLPRHLDLYACAFGRMLYGILGEITDCLPQRLAIAVDVDRGVRADHPNFLALLHGQRSH